MGQHRGQHVAVTEVEVPVVGARDGKLLRRRGGHGARPRVQAAARRVDSDQVRRRWPRQGDQRLQMRVRGDGGGDCELH